MYASLKWLGDYVDIIPKHHELADKLTMAGMEVKAIQTIGSNWNDVVVGHVTAVTPHPNADKLHLVTVNLGSQQITVVCGAPNIRVGQKVPFAKTGAKLIDGHTGKIALLKPARIRGILSEGMVCSEKELGISENHDNILVLSSEAPIGMPLDDYMGDVIFDLDVTPNRPDCLSMIGIAREIAALTGKPLHLPQICYEEAEKAISQFISVDIIEPVLCPRYCASLITGVKVAPSPGWLQQYLRSYGMRPINNVVDISNYVMLEYGQPLHTFDYHKLNDKQIIIRRAKDGEIIVSLDEIKRTLTQNNLIIVDMKKPVAIAGLMGGFDTGVTSTTTAILVESANFNRGAIRRSAEQLNLQSEASIRFGKGLNPDLPPIALKRATQLLLQLTGGKAAEGIIDIYPGKTAPHAILLSSKEVKRLSGLKVNINEILRILNTLGFECQKTDSVPAGISVLAPYWRSDIKCAADLAEEVIRIIGYDKIPITRLSASLPPQKFTPQRSLKQKLRNTLIGWGFQEILTYSLTSLEKLQKLSSKSKLRIDPLQIANPMTKKQEYLRTTLRAGLLTAMANNQKHEETGIRLFEIGKIFLPQHSTAIRKNQNLETGEKELPQEKEMLCIAFGGSQGDLSWRDDRKSFDFFDAKGVVEGLLKQLGLVSVFEPCDDEGLLLGKSANVILDGDKAGVVGNLHPRVAQAFELSDTICLIEMDLDKLMSKTNMAKRYQPIPQFPSITRDIALVIDRQVAFQQVENIIQGFPLVKKATLFDVYTGKQIPEGKKSFAIRIIYQSAKRTLTEKQIDKIQQQMLNKLHRELGTTLRD
ncbi:MAG: phenylalanine--tRNA ligase subunit beta [Dehalococcoidia bacterium]|nr:phenylalanine--tRNA ligase subunit beta [Dehalococcoidia bacterium]